MHEHKVVTGTEVHMYMCAGGVVMGLSTTINKKMKDMAGGVI